MNRFTFGFRGMSLRPPGLTRNSRDQRCYYVGGSRSISTSSGQDFHHGIPPLKGSRYPYMNSATSASMGGKSIQY